MGWTATPRDHPALAVPPALEPGHAARVRVRRDLLRQGRLVAVHFGYAPRLHRERRRRRQPADPGRPDTRACGSRTHRWWSTPRSGKWMIGLGEKVFGLTPLGWRVVPAVVGTLMILVMIRFVRRLTGSTLLGLRGRADPELRRPGVRAVPAGPARHLRGVLAALRRVLPGADRDWYRARMADRVDGQVEGDGWGPVRALLFRPWLLVSGHLLGAGLRQQVGGDLPAGRVRPARCRLVRGCAEILRRQLRGRRRRSWSTGSRRSSTSCWSRSSSTSPPGPAG